MTRVQIPGTNQVTDRRTLAMFTEVDRLNPHITVRVTQGSYRAGQTAASSDTHDGGGALDLHAASLTPAHRIELVTDMRRVGFAAWLRTPSQSDWPFHIHGIAIGCSDLSPGALRQVKQYLDGLNGLASKGPDDGPAGFYGMTWEKYMEMKNAPAGPDITVSMTSIQMAVRGELVTHTRAADVTQFMGFVGPGGLELIPDYTVQAWLNARDDAASGYGAKFVRYGVTQLQLYGKVTPDGVFGPVTATLMKKYGGYNIVA